MNSILTLLAAIVLSTSVHAEEKREVAMEELRLTETTEEQRSFFQPKTVEDISALVTLETELETYLAQEISH